MKHLLAVDLGLSCGLALYGQDGRLRWCRSHHFPDRTRLKRALWRIVRDSCPLAPEEPPAAPHLDFLVTEGDRELGLMWRRVAEKLGAQCLRISAERWRQSLFYPRQRESGKVAKAQALDMADQVVRWSGLPGRRLGHDAAEAVLIGLWGVVEVGWLDRTSVSEYFQVHRLK